MKVTKVDIKKEILDVREGTPYLRFAVRDQIMAQIMETGKTPDMVTVQEKTYFIRQVYNPETKVKDLYAVEENDKKIFDDLIAVSFGYIEQEIQKAVKIAQEKWLEDLIYRDIPKAESGERKRIKKLAWWKRLFNRF